MYFILSQLLLKSQSCNVLQGLHMGLCSSVFRVAAQFLFETRVVRFYLHQHSHTALIW